MLITTDTLRDVLRQVIDPEVGMNIVDLGLVYRLEVIDAHVQLDLTMTSPACPMGEGILDEAEAALNACIPASWIVEARLVWAPAWTPARMSENARLHFGWNQ